MGAVDKSVPPRDPIASHVSPAPRAADIATDFCENCGETRQLAKIKGCIRCLRCGFKADCSGM